LIGLSRCILDWLIKTNKTLNYPYDSIILGSNPDTRFTFIEWAQKIDQNFEKYFWISSDSTESKHINKRNIYKDTLNSSIHYSDYQLRPNFLIALTLSPQMFNKEHAKKAIEKCRLHLLNEPNSIGIKTLDCSDFNYCGNYDNANDSNDTKVAHGFNYHQGPEWLIIF
jgi:glycogen debranching enzyme